MMQKRTPGWTWDCETAKLHLEIIPYYQARDKRGLCFPNLQRAKLLWESPDVGFTKGYLEAICKERNATGGG
jgi:hypothetical protein